MDIKISRDIALLEYQWWRGTKSINYITKYVGTKIYGVEVTLPGILAAAHLGGAGGVIRFFDSLGNYNPKDIFGTSLFSYLRDFSDYKYNSTIILKNKIKCLENSLNKPDDLTLLLKYSKLSLKGAIFEKHGNCIDIKTGKTYIPNTNCVGVNYVPLGFKAELPRYYRGVLLLRSSSAKKYNIDMPCGYGEIEWDYAGEWNGIIRTHKSSKEINAGDRVFQFYIEPLWNSPWYIKLIDIFFSI